MRNYELLWEMLKVLAGGIGALTLLGAIVFGVVSLVVTASPTDDSDASRTARSGLNVHTDNLTGCQYLSYMNGGLTPRWDANGGHVGCRN